VRHTESLVKRAMVTTGLLKTLNSKNDGFPCLQKARSRKSSGRNNFALKGEHQKLKNDIANSKG